MILFGPFELDPGAGELRREGVAVKLQPQPLKVLTLLASRPGEIVTREEIRRAVWGDGTFVDFDQGVGYCLSQIRGALGDDAQSPRYVQTLPRRGYRFLAPVRVDGRPRARRRPDAPALGRITRTGVGLLAFVAALGIAMQSSHTWPTPPEGVVRVAVLPFEDLGSDPGAVPLGAALAEEILAQLGRFDPDRLRVIARWPTASLRQSPRDLEQLGRELGVNYVLEGSVRFEGHRVRITSRLVRLEDLEQVWVRSYDRQVGDLLALERQVAADTARQVRVALAPGSTQRSRPAPGDPEARRLTVVANHHTARRTPEALEKALVLYRQALERDPGHAPAWAGLAEALLALADRGLRPAGDALAEANTAARRAIELDPGLGTAQAVVGAVAHIRDWDWAKAGESYDRALALDPTDARVHRWYSHLLLITGRPAEALDHARQAVESDPLSLQANANLTCILLSMGRYEEALEQARRTEQLEPATDANRLSRAEALLGLGRAEEALALLADVRQPDYREACSLVRANTLKALGRTREAREELLALLRSVDDPTHRDEWSGGSVGFTRARILASLGEHDAALAELERAVESHDPEARWLTTTEEFAPLRDDPRMKQLYRRLGRRSAARDLGGIDSDAS